MDQVIGYLNSAQRIMESLGCAPAHSSVGKGRPGIQICRWRGTIDTCSYEEPGDLLFVYHVGGMARVPVAAGRDRHSSISRPGLISILHENSAVRWDVGGEFRSLSLHISREYFPERRFIGNICEQMRIRPKLAFRDPFIVATLDVLAAEMISADGGEGLLAESLVDALLAYVERNFCDPQHSPAAEILSEDTLKLVCDHIDNSLESQLSVDELARIAGLCRSQFSKKFHLSTRKTPYQYVIERRVRVACDLLKCQNEELSEIAYRCGFSSQSHFSTIFKRITGKTPAAYRKE